MDKKFASKVAKQLKKADNIDFVLEEAKVDMGDYETGGVGMILDEFYGLVPEDNDTDKMNDMHHEVMEIVNDIISKHLNAMKVELKQAYEKQKAIYSKK
jgi:hypothetical protein